MASKMAPRRFLIVSPHPDDAELGLGGTIIKLKEKKCKVFIVDLTSGEPTPFGNKKLREKEARQASKILNIDQRVNLDLENRFLFDNKSNRLLLAEKIREFKPDILFTPYPVDSHPDHLAATRITEGARFYAKYTKLNTIRGKPHYPLHIFYYFCTHLKAIPRISFLIDISSQFKRKMKAVRCYRSQFITNSVNRFIFSYLDVFNRYLGQIGSCGYAEGVYCQELVRADILKYF